MTGADDVVQPYTLPKSIYTTVQTFSKSLPAKDTSRAASSTIGADPEDGPDFTPLTQLAGESAPNDEEASSEDDMEEIIHIEPPDAPILVPKTMRELAEDAARRREDRKSEEAGAKKTTPMVQEPTTISTSRVAVSSAGNAPAASDANSTTPNGVTPSRRNAPKRKAPRTGKRARADNSDDSDGEEQIARPKRSPAKRARAAAAPVPPSDRVLRTRTPKVAEQSK